jgi:cobalt/nickel transport protein
MTGVVFALPAAAHFGMVIPSDNMVMMTDQRTISVDFSFSHPFEEVGMELVKPRQVFVVKDGKLSDLKGQLTKSQVMGHLSWQLKYGLKRPGTYFFCMEPAEDCFIVHYTKTVVTALGDDEGWDAELGLKTEIVPLANGQSDSLPPARTCPPFR